MSNPLQPGIKAPNFTLPAASLEGDISLEGHQAENVILVFFPSSMEEGLVEQLEKFQGKAAVRNKIKLPPVLFINGIPLEGPRTQEAIRARIEVLLACIPGQGYYLVP